MGRSKFPGKPAKLVNKKRISVINNQLNSDTQNDPSELVSRSSEPSESSASNGSISQVTKASSDATTTITKSDIAINNVEEKNLIDDNVTDKNETQSPLHSSRTTSLNKNNLEQDDGGDQSSNVNNKIKIGQQEPQLSLTNTDAMKKEKNIKSSKKKTVTFRSILETSDDLNIKKKVYNPNVRAPLVPIIKKECLTRQIRYSQNDCIIQPSRLTETLQRKRLDNIDKLNSLTFKSSPYTSNFLDTDRHGHSRSSSSSSTSSKTSPEDGSGTVIGDKRFILPRRSVHSCRVIKPNKKFLDDSLNSTKPVNKKGKKKNQKRNESSTKSGSENEDDDNGKGENECVSHETQSSNDNCSESGEHIDECDIESSNQKKDSKSDYNPFSLRNVFETKEPIFSSKVILREPRLQVNASNSNHIASFGLKSGGFGKKEESPISNLFTQIAEDSTTITSSLSAMNTFNKCCTVCGTNIVNLPLHKCQKFGVLACLACRKFISKRIKKLAGTGSNIDQIQCCKDGNCNITPIVKHSSKSYKIAFKTRCPSCWLQKCLKKFANLPLIYKNRLANCLPTAVCDSSDLNTKKEHNFSFNPWQVDFGSNSSPLNINQGTNIFVSNNNSNSIYSKSLSSWTNQSPKDFGENKTISSTKLLQCANPLSENNATFGSTPELILESKSDIDNLKNEVASSLSPGRKIVDSKTNEGNENGIAEEIKSDDTTNQKQKLRYKKETKERNETPLDIELVTNVTSTVPNAVISPSTSSTSIEGTDKGKRQRIDLKGPRVKHVCRSAQIALGQPIATFENDLQTIEDPSTEDIVSVTADNVKDLVTPELNVKTRETKMEIAAKVIAKTLNKNVALISDITKQIQIPQPHNEGNSQKPTTRKLTRLPLAINAIANQITNKNVNAFIRKPFMHQGNQQQPQVYMPPLISIDFWENYDPAEVSQTGFGLIISEDLSIRALCFLCGSAGTDSMIFCICCCEPYHQYCVEDEYNIKHNTVFDETGLNLSSVNGSLNSSLNNQLNWVCPRCTVCYSCNMSSGSKVKCQKCQKNYHSTCLGTSKRLLGADRPLICAQCLKCKSCGTTKVTKFVGNLPMCSGCFRLRQKGNFCPLCQKCYEENDFNLKMMECGECRRWVHAKCEGLTDEQYNMLSVLPEHIEFICKNCAKNSIIAESWRDAVAVEFKSGLLSVVRLLSKSRQACALLKLSPRKKLSNCICMPIQNHRSIQFNTKESSKSRHNECESPESTQLVGINYGNDSIESIKSNIFSSMNNLHDNDLLAIQSSSNQQYVKCYCSASQKQNISAPSLLEIKRKVNNNEYYSVGDFNYDMNAIITAAGCHDLLVTYKEILSETFPWYQNETKACTDALEEDMYDSNSSTGFVLNAGLINNLQERDQSIPMLPIPEDVDDYFYSSEVSDSRLCLFCKQIGDKDSFKESRMLYCGQNNWVHTNCALWSAEVFEEIDGSLQNIQSAISRGRLTKCSHCKNKGATVGCNAKNCGEQYHFICARESNCSFLVDKTVYCSQHLIEVSKKNISIESNFEVSRPIYVELDRKKKKLMDPNVIKFVIGSLKINHFGKIIPAFSDKSSILVPVDFKCSRLYWSTKEPWKIVLYRVRTYIQSKTTITSLDYGKNFTVDHTSNMETVQYGLNQISKWHDSLNTNINDYNDIRSDHRFMKNFADVEVMNEDEPQNNGDLLPPEIKDAIFEDLPHDILEGISMLDIFPKLMTYEDITNIDAARLDLPSYLSDNDDCDDNTMSSSNNRKESNENSNEWILPQTSGHVSDAMISAFNKRGGLNKELKNNKSELFSKNVDGNRIGFRTTPFAWNHKLDASNNVVVKRRKLTRSGLSFSDNGMFFNKSQERRRSLPSDELPRSKSFSWNPLKRPAPPIIDEELTLSGDSLLSKSSIEALKISQLDGADDTSDNDTITISTTVKCDKCQCTYRTNESYQRHLANCEPILSSESESDTPKSPDFQTLGQLSSINGSNLCNIPVFTMAQSHGGQQILNFNPTLGIGAIPLNSIQSQNPLSVHQTHHPQTITIQQNDLHQGNITIGQNGVPQNISNMLLSSTSSDHGQSNGHGNLNLTQSMQPQLFSNIANIAGHRTTTTTNINQYSTTNTAQIASNGIFQTATKQQQSLTNIGIPNSVNISYAQQANGQLIPIANGANNNSQIVTISSTPQSIKHMQSPVKQQLILPSPTGKKPIGSQYARLQSNSNRSKSRPLLSPKTSSMNKRIMAKTEMKTTTQQLITHPQQHNIPILSTAANNNIFVQPQVNSAQPLIVQQMSNANPGSNLVSYMTPDGQIFAIPTGNSTANTNDFKPQQTQFLTPNPLIPGAFQLQTADTNNLVLTTNAAGGLQVVPSSTLQLASTAQPQLIGTLIQPHGAAIQCGMIQSAEQVIGLGSTPTLDLVGQSAPGCMVLSNQPVYYGLETIVQNTVMSSQQFVSTAMQGVLSQNSSFSATTTQVFQASKIEPIMEVPQGYVLLNADGTMLTQQSSQPTNIITTTNPLQQNVQPLQQVPTSINGGTAWRIIDSSDSQSISTTQPVIHTSINSTIQPQIINQPVMQQKPIITQSPITVSKLPTQIVNKVAPTTLNKSPSTISPLEVNTITEKMNNNMPVMITVNSLQNKQSDTQQKVTNDISQLMKIQPLQRKSNPIKPITKVNGIKPKLIAKPVMKPRIIKLPNGSQPTHTKNDSIAAKPSVTINITTIAQPIINTNDLCEAETKPRVDNAGGSSLASTFSNISDTDNVHQIKSVRPNCISINSNQQHQLNTDYNNIAPVVSSPVTSIQLPLAPHTSCYPSGIPTNVVNPIQQTIQNNTKTSCTARRPTNRVLPMQTVHFKSASPPTISNQELKLDIESNEKKYEENQLLELSPASISDLNDAHGITKCQSRLRRKISEETISPCQLMETNATGNLNDDPSLDPMFDDESLDPFDKLKAEDNTIISSLSNMNSRQSNNEVKDKITEILNQLENDECEGSILSEVNDAESSSKLEKMSEVTDSAIDSMKFTCDDKKATSIAKGSDDPSLLYEIQSEDGFTFTSSSVTEIWEKVFEAVQIARKAHGLEAVPEGRLTDISGYQMLGLTTNAVKYMLEQLPGSEKCINYTPRYHKNNHNFGSTSNIVGSNGDLEESHENVHGAIRCAPFENRSEYDMFSWLASRHRKQPIQVQVQVDSELALRRGTGSNLPMAMKYRTLKDSYKDYVGVYRSHIHGRGLFCIRDIEAGEMVIEYAGELIRSTLTDKRERYYDSRGIGCYMFKIDDNLVVDATMRGNAARFINHSCEPNCYSKVVDILGHKHIIIFALRRIIQGEELTYDYKFPFEDVKIPCTCGSKKCRKYLN